MRSDHDGIMAAKLAMYGYGPCVNTAALELCRRAWPGIQFLVAKKEP